MRDNDTNCQSSDHFTIATDHEFEALENPAEPVAAPLSSPIRPDSRSTTKPHRNTGSLDSLGGGWLP